MGKTASKKSVVKGPVGKSASANGQSGKGSVKPAVAGKSAKVAAKPAAPARATKPAASARPVAASKAPVRPAVKPAAAKPAPKPAAPAPASKVTTAPKATTAAKTVPTKATTKGSAPGGKVPAGGKLARVYQPGAIILPPRPPGSPPIKPVAKPAEARPAKAPKIEAKPEPYRPMNLPEQVNSSGDSKPKKNQAGLSAKELEFFRDLLLAKRRELVGDMSSMEREALQSGDSGLSTLPIHMADMGTDNYEQEFTLGLVEKDRTLLREINHALAKIQNGSYGVCEGNGKPIAKVRLEAQPWARFSIEYARLQEKGAIRR